MTSVNLLLRNMISINLRLWNHNNDYGV
uniref:Uncharacterized protein n=1 Tax=Rhizophora mucronata TaxID=61149 RepID=A0A2P2NCK1_RHIMU